MSDITTSNFGCGSDSGCDSWIWIIIAIIVIFCICGDGFNFGCCNR